MLHFADIVHFQPTGNFLYVPLYMRPLLLVMAGDQMFARNKVNSENRALLRHIMSPKYCIGTPCMNFRDTLYVRPSSYPDMINRCKIMKKDSKSVEITNKSNAMSSVVPLVTSLSIFKNGQFVGDFAKAANFSRLR